MTNSKILFNNLVRDIKVDESKEEIRAIALTILDHFGISQTEILSNKMTDLDYSTLFPITERLNNHEPVQYILNEAWFLGHKFFVDRSVLIPRPETELLVEEAARFLSTHESANVLDIGTGSGCIAISLAILFPSAKISAIDISEEALRVSRLNAYRHGAQINFLKHDILSGPVPDLKFDLIVSNPPYISNEEKSSIAKNVIDYEPHVALFADDALIFYKAIARIVGEAQNRPAFALEINPTFALEIKALFEGKSQTDTLFRKDFSNHQRIISSLS